MGHNNEDYIIIDEKLYTSKETAKLLRVGQFTILRLINAGRLKASKFGRAYSIYGSDIKEFVVNNFVPMRPSHE